MTDMDEYYEYGLSNDFFYDPVRKYLHFYRIFEIFHVFQLTVQMKTFSIENPQQ